MSKNITEIDPALFEKERQVLKYRKGGLTFDAIAERLGYANESSARAAFKRAIERTRDDALAAEGRLLHRARLETALLAIWDRVREGDLKAIDTMLRILDQDAKLFGLNMPVKTEVEVTSYDGNLLRQRTREIVQTLREIRESQDSVGDGSSPTGTTSE
jgi:hypothetical protein